MKKVLILGIILMLFATVVFAQQIPPNWWIGASPPRDTAQHIFQVAMSNPSATEQEALREARQNGMQQFALSISPRFEGLINISSQSQLITGGMEDIIDELIIRMETSAITINVPLSGIRELDRRIERDGNRFIARILLSMSVEDYDKARLYIDNEEAAALAYRFFGQRNLFQIPVNQRPAGYDGFYSWMRNNCVIIAINDTNANALLPHLDQLITRIYRDAVIFPHVIDGHGARIIYDSRKHYDGILRALQNISLFNIQREGIRLVLRPVRANILADFRTAVNNIKDSSRFVVTGIETIQTESGEIVNTNAVIIPQFRTIVPRLFNMRSENFAIPSQFLSNGIDEAGILQHIQNNFASFPARFLVISRTQTRLDRGIAGILSPSVRAETSFTVYDLVTGGNYHSDTIQSPAAIHDLSNMEERTIITRSRDALLFLNNPRNGATLEQIIRSVFERL
jgi:hypothetical protein